MNVIDRSEARREVENLRLLAMDAHDQGHYAMMERLLERATETAERLDDLPLEIETRFWLADARRMQGEYTQALTSYTWLIGVATDPDQSRHLFDAATLRYLARAFADFLDCGRLLPQLPVEQLLCVAADGLAWLERVNQPNWSDGLRLQRGLILRQRGETEAARRDLEGALALRRRHADAHGYSLSWYRLNLARLLTHDLKAHAKAAELLEETLNDPVATPNDRSDASCQLAHVRKAQGNLAAAEEAARVSLEVACQEKDRDLLLNAYGILGRVQLGADRLDAATESLAQQWRCSRRIGSTAARQIALMDCARLRLSQGRKPCECALLRLRQARQVWRITEGAATPPRLLLAGAEGPLAARRLRSARRFLQRARRLAEQLDHETGRREYQAEVTRVTIRANELAALVVSATSA